MSLNYWNESLSISSLNNEISKTYFSVSSYFQSIIHTFKIPDLKEHEMKSYFSKYKLSFK